MTQGHSLFPTIFNAVVDTVVRNWVSLVAEYAGGQDRLGRGVIQRATFFYMEDGLVASTDPEWMQGSLDTLTGLFDRVGLRTIARKKVGMLCFPCSAFVNQPEAAYKQRMIEYGLV